MPAWMRARARHGELLFACRGVSGRAECVGLVAPAVLPLNRPRVIRVVADPARELGDLTRPAFHLDPGEPARVDLLDREFGVPVSAV
jgi:hypothetical protein